MTDFWMHSILNFQRRIIRNACRAVRIDDAIEQRSAKIQFATHCTGYGRVFELFVAS